MDRSKDILQHLKALKIPYVLYEHEPKLSVEACQTTPGIDWGRSSMCKNVFLCNRQETQFYLMLMRYDRPFKTAVVSKLIGVSRLSFAKQEHLSSMIQLDPGAVNPLSLIYDTEKRIRLAIDDSILGYEYLLFHPGVNFKTVSLKSSDFLEIFLPACGHNPIILTLLEE